MTSAQNPLEVTFLVTDEKLAYQLDRLIAYEAGGDPDRWFNALLAERASTEAAAVPARLAGLAETVGECVDPGAVAAWDGAVPATVPPRPAAARAPRISSTWRTR